MKEINLVFIVIITSVLFLLYGVSSLSIRYEEAVILFEGTSLIHYLVYFSTKLFGQTDLALRLPFILLHIGSLVLLYKIGKLFLKRKLDRVVSIALYAMLPGVNSIAILVNGAYIAIFLTLLFIYLYMYGYKKASFAVLIIALFADNSFAILYLSLFFYSILNKEKQLLTLSLALFGLSMYIYGFDTGGKPKGYFLDTLGVYAAVFSLFLFIYLVYALYRILIKEEKNLLWSISFFSLVISLILSLRQKLLVEDFAVFVVIAIPLVVKVFFNSYRVRLPQHRKYHNISFGVVFIFLVLNLGVSYFNKPLYFFIKDPSNHLAYKYHIAKDLAQILKDKNINNIDIEDSKLALRLKFYGIQSGSIYKLSHSKFRSKIILSIQIGAFMKRAFTMIELVFVIVIVGIISVMIAPNFQGNNLRQAADQVVSHIRYTQHLAMMDNKFDTTDANWFQTRWQISFVNNPGSDNQWSYTVFSDFKGVHDGNPNPSSVADPRSEIASNPLDPVKFLTGGTSGGALIQFDDNRATKNLNLGNEFGITSVVVAGGGPGTTNVNKIIFDNVGRPYKGANNSFNGPVHRVAQTQITITLSDGTNNEVIAIEPETGYTHIL